MHSSLCVRCVCYASYFLSLTLSSCVQPLCIYCLFAAHLHKRQIKNTRPMQSVCCVCSLLYREVYLSHWKTQPRLYFSPDFCAHPVFRLSSPVCVRVCICLRPHLAVEMEIRRDGGGVWRKKDWMPQSKGRLFFSLRAKPAPQGVEREKFRQARTCCTRTQANVVPDQAELFLVETAVAACSFPPPPSNTYCHLHLYLCLPPAPPRSPARGQARVSIRWRVV